MPQFAIVDTHLHIWDPTRLKYPWHASVPQLDRPFLLSDYDEHRATVDVERMVFLECDVAPEDRLAEAQWVTQEAQADARIQAIVASAPLENGVSARPDLETLAELPLVHGIRRLIQDEPDVDFCVQPDFIAGVKLLPEFGFTFDVCIQHRHMANAVRLARSCPEVTFILDHIGKPGIGDGLLEPWRQHLRELADLPNVHCKVSGLVTAADHAESRAASGPGAMRFAWTREQLRPYIDHAIESFGFDRVMYGGDWPVSTLAAKYPDWVAVLDWATAGSTEEEMQNLYRRNAIAFYRLS